MARILDHQFVDAVTDRVLRRMRQLAGPVALRGADAVHATPRGQAMTTPTSRTIYRALSAGPAWWPWRWQVYAFRPLHPNGDAGALPMGRRMRREEAEHEAAWQNACETKRLNKRVGLR
jgi:hypothetical protein